MHYIITNSSLYEITVGGLDINLFRNLHPRTLIRMKSGFAVLEKSTGVYVHCAVFANICLNPYLKTPDGSIQFLFCSIHICMGHKV